MTEELVILVSQELQDLDSDLPKSFCKLFLRRLEVLGCPVTEEEESFALAFAARKTEVEILNYCHIDLIPAVLYPLLCDRAAGRYLYDRKQMGKLEVDTLDLSGAFSSLTEGDMTVSFSSGTSDSEKLDQLIQMMMASGKEQLKCYRKVKF